MSAVQIYQNDHIRRTWAHGLLSTQSLLIIVLLASLQSLLYMTPVIETDGVGYVLITRSLANDLQLTLDTLVYTPGYPIMALPFTWLTGDAHLGCLLTSVTSTVASIVLVWHLGRRLFSPEIGFLASVLLLFSVFFMRKSFWVMAEPTYTFLMLVAALFVIRCVDENKIRNAIGLGFALSLLHLTRPEGVIVAVALLAVLIVAGLCLRRAFFKLAVYGVVAGVILACSYFGYIAYVHSLTGEWVVSTKTHVNWYIAHANYYAEKMNLPNDDYLYHRIVTSIDSPETAVADFERPHVLQFILSEPVYFIKHYLDGVREIVWYLAQSMNLFLVLSVVGIVAALKQASSRYKTILLMIFLLQLAVYPVFFVMARVVETLIPLLIIFAAYGLLYLYRLYREYKQKTPASFIAKPLCSSIALAFVITCLVGPLGAVVAKKVWEQSSGHYDPELLNKAAGLWLRDHSGENAAVMGRKNWVAFYAQRESDGIPWGSEEKIYSYMRDKHIKYLVVDNTFTKRPALNYLLENPAASPDFLTAVYEGKEHGYQIVVFEANFDF